MRYPSSFRAPACQGCDNRAMATVERRRVCSGVTAPGRHQLRAAKYFSSVTARRGSIPTAPNLLRARAHPVFETQTRARRPLAASEPFGPTRITPLLRESSWRRDSLQGSRPPFYPLVQGRGGWGGGGGGGGGVGGRMVPVAGGRGGGVWGWGGWGGGGVVALVLIHQVFHFSTLTVRICAQIRCPSISPHFSGTLCSPSEFVSEYANSLNSRLSRRFLGKKTSPTILGAARLVRLAIHAFYIRPVQDEASCSTWKRVTVACMSPRKGTNRRGRVESSGTAAACSAPIANIRIALRSPPCTLLWLRPSRGILQRHYTAPSPPWSVATSEDQRTIWR